ncbi:MAG TPA: hypothetical protein VJY39_12235 [Acidisphaera sp.]|nr:hypothetical protein [Acidisphaera sp.]
MANTVWQTINVNSGQLNVGGPITGNAYASMTIATGGMVVVTPGQAVNFGGAGDSLTISGSFLDGAGGTATTSFNFNGPAASVFGPLTITDTGDVPRSLAFRRSGLACGLPDRLRSAAR